MAAVGCCFEEKPNYMHYHPGQNISLDETMIKFNGRLGFNQYIQGVTFVLLSSLHPPPQPEKPDDQQNQERIYRLKDEHSHFTLEASLYVMALVGESEVPAHRCGVVIQTVVRQVLGARVPDGDLSSQCSAFRISDHAHVMSKAHVAEVLLQEDFHDLHVDGISRGGQKCRPGSDN